MEDFSRDKRRKLFTWLSLFASVMGLVHFTQDLWAGAKEAPLFDLLISIICFSCYLIHRRGYQTAASIAVLLLLNVSMAMYACLVPKEVGIFLFYFPLMVISQALFNDSEKWMRFFFMILSGGLVVALFLTDFDLIGPYSIEAPNVEMFFLINLGSSLFMVAVSIRFILKVNAESERRLQIMAEEIRVKNENLEKTNAELDRFLYSTSHDLRSPLMSIKGLVNIAKKESSDPLMQQYLAMMTERADKLENFIKDIIDYSKNKRTEVVNEVIDLSKLIDDVHDNFKFLDGASDIQFQKEIAAAEIITDRSRITVVLNNLISNAIKYHKSNGVQSWIKVSASNVDNQLNLVVADNGPGIDVEKQPRIFEMFYRGTEQSKGSGLGLYIVKETIEKMSGTIRIESAVGVGTSFFITLPLSSVGTA